MKYKPVIAIVPLGHYIYFEQFEGLYEELNKKSAEFAAYFEDTAEILITDYVDTVPKAFETVRSLKKQDVDGIFMLLTTYLPSAVAAPFANYLDVPQILVGIQPLPHLDYKKCTTFMQLVNDDICAMPEIAGAYVRLGRSMPPCIVAASRQTEEIRAEVLAWQRAIVAKAAFKYAQFGYLGHTYEGMYDMHTDPTAFSGTFHSHVKMLEMCELAQLADAVTEDMLREKISVIRNTFSIQDPSVDPLTDYVQDSDLEWSARMACALDMLVKNNDLSALAYYYKGENNNLYERIGAALIIGNTLLTSSGIPLAGEADLKTAATMLIMSKLGGGGSFAELHPFDIEGDCVLVGHDGPHNIAISQGQPILRKLKKYHGKSGSGIGVEFSIRAGDITMLSMNYQPNGRFKLIAAAGISLPGDIPQTGNTNTRVTFPGIPVTEFIRRWCEAGPTHHLALGVGNHLREIRYFARIMNLDLEIIE
ncbi:MAG: L-fucose/L-arabinose isomerase family protein [Eubacteriales bacterium]|nr:L-fucose/L-arabinose isomerase family protein [Eubacteriales bacterium]